MPIKRVLKCYTGPMNDHQTGMIMAYGQRQAQNLLKIGHKRFHETWVMLPEVPKGFEKYVVYVRPSHYAEYVGNTDGWVARVREL